MTKTHEETHHEPKRNPDQVNAEVALKRAANKTRELDRNAGTIVVIYENGKIKEEYETNDSPLGTEH